MEASKHPEGHFINLVIIVKIKEATPDTPTFTLSVCKENAIWYNFATMVSRR